MKNLTCAGARAIDLVAYLAFLGYQPDKVHYQNYWYRSPLREEQTPSFKVNRTLNLWFDHGIGKGGNLVDFGVQYFNCTVADLLNRLANFQLLHFSFHPQLSGHRVLSFVADEKKEPAGSKIVIKAVRPIANEMLLTYLRDRNITPGIARDYCREIVFSLYGKDQTALGFLNDSGGYELRSSFFKGSSAPKDSTYITGDTTKKEVNVLEGFTDFLSLKALRKRSDETHFLVLNSLSFIRKNMEALKQFETVSLYLDQDNAGRKATAELCAALPQAKDMSSFYRQHKDLNDYLRQATISVPQQLPEESADVREPLKKGRRIRR